MIGLLLDACGLLLVACGLPPDYIINSGGAVSEPLPDDLGA